MTRLVALTTLLALLKVGSSLAAYAQDTPQGTTTGLLLTVQCMDPDPSWIDFCNGYVQAVYDMAARTETKACVPTGMSRGAVVSGVVEFLSMALNEQGPSGTLMAGPAYSAVMAILHRQFPCA